MTVSNLILEFTDQQHKLMSSMSNQSNIMVVRVHKDLSFRPQRIYPDPGQTVRFINQSGESIRVCVVPENAVFDGLDDDGGFALGSSEPGNERELTVRADAVHIRFQYRASLDATSCEVVWGAYGIGLALESALSEGSGKGEGGGTTGP